MMWGEKKRDNKDADVIVESLLERPDEWNQQGSYCILHKSGLQLWVGNGVNYLEAYRSTMPCRLGFFGKRRVWLAYRQWQHNRLKEVLKVNHG